MDRADLIEAIAFAEQRPDYASSAARLRRALELHDAGALHLPPGPASGWSQVVRRLRDGGVEGGIDVGQTWQTQANQAGWVPPLYWQGAQGAADTLDHRLGRAPAAPGTAGAFLPTRIASAAAQVGQLLLYQKLLVFVGLPAAFATGVLVGVLVERRRVARRAGAGWSP